MTFPKKKKKKKKINDKNNLIFSNDHWLSSSFALEKNEFNINI
jgi:hypothetical protein